MADITLAANTNYSALTVANGDRILLAGFTLNLDVNPTQTGVTVQAIDATNTTGNTGNVTLGSPTSYTLSGWTLKAGTGPLLATIASGQTVGGVWVGGLVSGGAYAISTNNGTLAGSVTGGSGTLAMGVNNNNGVITGSVTGGPGSIAHGVNANTSTASINGDVTGGTTNSAYGVGTNYGSIAGNVKGGTTGNTYGVNEQRGTITGNVLGTGSTYGVANNNGTISGDLIAGSSPAVSNNMGVLTGNITSSASANAVGIGSGSYISSTHVIKDNTKPAFGAITGKPVMMIRGANLQSNLPAGFTIIYYIGAISTLATINGSPTMVQLSEGGTKVYIAG